MFFPINLLLLILIGSFVGFCFAYWYGRRTRKFYWSEYLALVGVPVAGCLALALLYGKGVVYLFFLSAGVGLLLEYSAGLAYHLVLHERLWTYGKFALKGRYTSVLVLPMWGVGGVISWLIAKSVGL